MKDNISRTKAPNGFIVGILIAVFVLNQFVIASVAEAMGIKSGMRMMMSIGVRTASAQMIMMPIPNEDGATTKLMEMPTITEVSGEPNTGDIIADAMTVMIAKGTPFYATGGMTDSKMIDSQSGYESAITGLLCALAGANLIHDAAGLMEFALTVCYEKYVIDNDILGMVMRAVDGIKVDDNTLAFELIQMVGPGGNFVTAKHTRRFMRKEHYQPSLNGRDHREEWEAKGRQTTWEQAAEMVPSIIANHNFSLPAEIRNRVLSEIKGIVD